MKIFKLNNLNQRHKKLESFLSEVKHGSCSYQIEMDEDVLKFTYTYFESVYEFFERVKLIYLNDTLLYYEDTTHQKPKRQQGKFETIEEVEVYLKEKYL